MSRMMVALSMELAFKIEKKGEENKTAVPLTQFQRLQRKVAKCAKERRYSMAVSKCRSKRFGHTNRFSGSIVEKHNACFDAGDFFSTLFVREFVEEITTQVSQIVHRDLDDKHIAVESFRLEHDGCIGHDDARALDIKLRPSVMAKEPDTGFVRKGEDSVVSEMTAIIDIADSYRDLG